MLDGLQFGVNVGWNDLTMDDDVVDAAGTLVFAKGDRLGSSPEYTVGASVDYAFPLGGNGYEGSFSASANYTSKQNTAISSPRPGDAMLVARTSFSIKSPHHWTATLFVDNVSNEQGAVYNYLTIPNWSARVRPRTVGAQLEYRYGRR